MFKLTPSLKITLKSIVKPFSRKEFNNAKQVIIDFCNFAVKFFENVQLSKPSGFYYICSMSRDNDKLESLIAGGLIGAALGALLSKDKEDGAFIGALLGAAFASTLKANQEAQKTNVPVYIEEDGKLYALLPGGKKVFIKNMLKPSRKFPQRFKLK